MYRSCIFCSADLMANDALERFPVGRSIAFDGEKGRLWAVCPKCARWNLAPIEERWEAIEDAERLFRDTRTRVQSENIGLAKLRDGTRLVRVGAVVPGELAAWRYGGALGRRRRRFVLGTSGAVVAGAALAGTVFLGVAGGGALINLVWQLSRSHVVPFDPQTFPAGSLLPDRPVYLDRAALRECSLVADPNGGAGVALHLPRAGSQRRVRWDGSEWYADIPATLSGPDAHRVLRHGLVSLNARGASRTGIERALGLLGPDGARGYLEGAAASRSLLVDPRLSRPERRARLLAVEMALHEETERRALDGELAALEGMWRQAEGIAAIADRLPDVPAADPPRI